MRSLTDAVKTILWEVKEIEVDEFMDKLYHYCWDRGIICLKWVLEDKGGKIQRFCTDAWKIIESMSRKGILEIVEINGRKIIRVKRQVRH